MITHNYGQWTWCGERPFGHRATHHQTFKPSFELFNIQKKNFFETKKKILNKNIKFNTNKLKY